MAFLLEKSLTEKSFGEFTETNMKLLLSITNPDNISKMSSFYGDCHENFVGQYFPLLQQILTKINNDEFIKICCSFVDQIYDARGVVFGGFLRALLGYKKTGEFGLFNGINDIDIRFGSSDDANRFLKKLVCTQCLVSIFIVKGDKKIKFCPSQIELYRFYGVYDDMFMICNGYTDKNQKFEIEVLNVFGRIVKIQLDITIGPTNFSNCLIDFNTNGLYINPSSRKIDVIPSIKEIFTLEAITKNILEGIMVPICRDEPLECSITLGIQSFCCYDKFRGNCCYVSHRLSDRIKKFTNRGWTIKAPNCSNPVCPLIVCFLPVCPLSVCPLSVCSLPMCSLPMCSLPMCSLPVCSPPVCSLPVKLQLKYYIGRTRVPRCTSCLNLDTSDENEIYNTCGIIYECIINSRKNFDCGTFCDNSNCVTYYMNRFNLDQMNCLYECIDDIDGKNVSFKDVFDYIMYEFVGLPYPVSESHNVQPITEALNIQTTNMHTTNIRTTNCTDYLECITFIGNVEKSDYHAKKLRFKKNDMKNKVFIKLQQSNSSDIYKKHLKGFRKGKGYRDSFY